MICDECSVVLIVIINGDNESFHSPLLSFEHQLIAESHEKRHLYLKGKHWGPMFFCDFLLFPFADGCMGLIMPPFQEDKCNHMLPSVYAFLGGLHTASRRESKGPIVLN